jgi:hypothetical protein
VLPKHTSHATRTFNKPDNWDDAANGQCVALSIRDVVIDGCRYMVSAWEPSPDELAAIIAGAPILLHISGTQHPVVAVGVGEPAEAEA